MKNLKEYISESILKSTKSGKQHFKNYFPKDNYELKELVKQLVKERGDSADLNDIDTSKITTMEALFQNCQSFNGDISGWDVSNVKNMGRMFECSHFNGDISGWDVSNVKNMGRMFLYSKFTGKNGDISGWDVGNVENMSFMFAHTNFSKNLSNWIIGEKCETTEMFDNCPIKEKFKPKFK